MEIVPIKYKTHPKRNSENTSNTSQSQGLSVDLYYPRVALYKGNKMSPSLTSPTTTTSNTPSLGTTNSSYSGSIESISTIGTRGTTTTSSSSSPLPLPLTKNVGVGANLTIPRANGTTSAKLFHDGLIVTSQSGSNGNGNLSSDHQHQQQLLHHQEPSPSLMSSAAAVAAATVLTVQSLPSQMPQLHQQPFYSHSHSHSSSSLTSLKNIQGSSNIHNNGHGLGSTSSSSATLIPASIAVAVAPAATTSSTVISGGQTRICSQNQNGTLAVTSVPSNDSELQLFRVLQRANLLNYFDVMIELGGDDVQQLCEAGEEEFLEIMALVGMASKPLHVRRLQKSLQEFMTQPHLFPGPMLGPPIASHAAFAGLNNANTSTATATMRDTSLTSTSAPSPHQLPIRPIPSYHSTSTSSPAGPPPPTLALISPGGNGTVAVAASLSPSSTPVQTAAAGLQQQPFLTTTEAKSLQMRVLAMRNNSTSTNNSELSRSNSPASSNPSPSSTSFPIPSQSPTGGGGGLNRNVISPSAMFPTPIPTPSLPTATAATNSTTTTGHHQKCLTGSSSSGTETKSQANCNDLGTSSNVELSLNSRISLSPIPFLQDQEKGKILEAARKIVDCLPEYMQMPRTSKRKGSSDYEHVIKLSEDDPRRIAEIRKFSPIYGRYDCKRKVHKPLTIHELSVNEAAAQLCTRVPALLTRRDELFLLARLVVREAGLPYSSIISSTCTTAAGSLLISQIQQNMAKKTASAAAAAAERNQTPSPDPYSHHHHHNNNNNNSIHSKRMRLGEPENQHHQQQQEFNLNRSSRPEFESDGSNSNNSHLSSYSSYSLDQMYIIERQQQSSSPMQQPFELTTTNSTRYDPILSCSSSPLSRYSNCSTSTTTSTSSRRNSLEPDDLSMTKVNPIEDNSETSTCSVVGSRTSRNNTSASTTHNMQHVKAEPR